MVSFLFWNLIREPLVSLGSIGLPQLPPRAAPRLPRPRRLQRGDPRGPAGLGRVLPLRGRALRHRRPGGGRALPDRPRRRDGLLARPQEPRAPARAVPARDARALAGEELPRAPQGEGRYVPRAEFEELRACGRATTEPQASRLLVPALARGGDRSTGAGSRSWTTRCWPRPRRPTGTPAWCHNVLRRPRRSAHQQLRRQDDPPTGSPARHACLRAARSRWRQAARRPGPPS